MKRNSLICLLLAGSLATTGLTGCSTTEPTTTDAAPAATTTVAPSDIATPASHKHMELTEEFPDEFDFTNVEEIERLFDVCEVIDDAKIDVQKRAKTIRIRATVNDTKFTLNINLSGADGLTKPYQIVTVAKLFWYCYPQMYARFAVKSSPTTITIKFENFGYEVASAGGSEVHIHDAWLKNNPQDYDCMTHELAHVLQGGWDGNYVPSYTDPETGNKDTYMIERFVDYCRYMYAYKGGYYNDMGWEMQRVTTENTYYKSVRMWAYLDYTYSTAEADIMKRIQEAVIAKKYGNADWEPEGKAWEEIFAGTKAAGKTLTELWEEYAAAPMAKLSTKPREQGGVSNLLATVPLRAALRERFADAASYLKVN